MLHAAGQQKDPLLEDRSLYLQIPPDQVQAVQQEIPKGVGDCTDSNLAFIWASGHVRMFLVLSR